MTKNTDSKLNIRFASLEDVPLIFSFIRRLAEYEKMAQDVVATEDKIRETLFGKKTYAEVLIADLDQTPVGFALFFHNYSTFLAQPGIYLEDLFVVPQARSFGIGRALIEKLASLAKERNCGRVEWWVLDWNKPAIEFYKKLGAKPMDDWTVFRISGEELDVLALKSKH